nr:transcriptional regulator [uncultured bacterium]
MDAGKKKRLEEAGWKVGSTRDFLGLSDEEAAAVERSTVPREGLWERRGTQPRLSADRPE